MKNVYLYNNFALDIVLVERNVLNYVLNVFNLNTCIQIGYKRHRLY